MLLRCPAPRAPLQPWGVDLVEVILSLCGFYPSYCIHNITLANRNKQDENRFMMRRTGLREGASHPNGQVVEIWKLFLAKFIFKGRPLCRVFHQKTRIHCGKGSFQRRSDLMPGRPRGWGLLVINGDRTYVGFNEGSPSSLRQHSLFPSTYIRWLILGAPRAILIPLMFLSFCALMRVVDELQSCIIIRYLSTSIEVLEVSGGSVLDFLWVRYPLTRLRLDSIDSTLVTVMVNHRVEVSEVLFMPMGEISADVLNSVLKL
ncbi:uncharacterized protein G2W53_004157 [Senna tora]|uniref:Uncharacterized protein n=1 Tax=Senna tora TaxID=362788 RepID=A0A835CH18_9FABA|nr:uncharacterized protein G2W53_004157 [Senna tora]